MTCLAIFFALFLPADGIAQVSYCLPNEAIIFSFSTKNGKRAVLVRDKANSYLVYRFGTAQKIEMEYPDRTTNSWKSFKHSAYERGGGIQNEAMHLDYVYFTNNGYKYVLYQTYFVRGDQTGIGVRIIAAKTGKVVDVHGLTKTQHGSLGYFRETNFIEEGDEIFE